MLEGKELEGKIGSVGTYEVDVTSEGKLKAMIGVEIDLVAELEKLAAKTSTKIDDQAIAWVKLLMGKA